MVDLPELPEDEALAAELALGLLEGAERAEALRRCLADPGFAAEVERWSLRLSPLLAAIPAAAPPDRVWEVIAARIGAAEAAAPAAAVATVGDTGALRRWRLGAFSAGAVAACLALVIVMRPPAPPPPAQSGPVAVSQLAGPEVKATMAVAFDVETGVLRLKASNLEQSAKKPELWVIPEDGVPRSLGIIQGDGFELKVPPEIRALLKEGVTLAISLEDPATAPHKAPTSTPILTGKISAI